MKIPRYTPIQTSNEGLRAPRQEYAQSPDAFGAGNARLMSSAGNQLSNIGDTLAKVAIAQQQRENDTWVAQSKAEMVQSANRIHYGSGDASDHGMFSRKGTQAKGLVKESAKAFDDTFETLIATAPSQAAQDRLKNEIAGFRASFLSGSARHESQQLQHARLQATTKEIEAQIQHITANSGDNAETIAKNFGAHVAPAVREAAILQGVDPDEMVHRAGQKINASIIEQNIRDGQLAAARHKLAYFNDGHGLDKDTAEQLAQRIEKKQILMEADSIAKRYERELHAGTMTAADIVKQTQGIKNKALKGPLTKAANAIIQQYKFDQKIIIDQGTVDVFSKMEKGSALQDKLNLVENLPEGTPAEKQIKLRARQQYNWYEKEYAENRGLSPRTDPLVFDGTLEKINTNAITNSADLDAVVGLAPPDRERLKKVLENTNQKLLPERLKHVFAVSNGWAADKVPTEAERSARGAFLKYAIDVVNNSTKDFDIEDLQDLSDIYYMKGQQSRAANKGHSGSWWHSPSLVWKTQLDMKKNSKGQE